MAGRLAPASDVAGGHTLPWSANFKMVWYVLLRPLRPELVGKDQVQIIVTRALNCSHRFTYCTKVHMIRPYMYNIQNSKDVS
jgi:hypothetical protein